MAHSVHLDFASSAPLLDESVRAMEEIMVSGAYDARRLYDDAIRSRYEIEKAREVIANFIGAEMFEVIFTSSHSESLASAIFGTTANMIPQNNVVVSPYESDVVNTCLEREKVTTKVISGNSQATIDLEMLLEILDEDTRLVCVPFAHPDTGTLQELNKIIDCVREKSPQSYIHVDARIAVGYYPIDFSLLDVEMLSFEPISFGGPSGIGVLILKRDAHLVPLLPGASQERARRAGLENSIGIAGAAGACGAVDIKVEQLSLLAEKKHRIDSALKIAGAQNVVDTSLPCLPHISSAYFPGIAASAIVAEFNRAGINIHAGSSCGSEEFEPSKQLYPITHDDSISESVFRISVGHTTTQSDIDAFIRALDSIELVRGFSKH